MTSAISQAATTTITKDTNTCPQEEPHLFSLFSSGWRGGAFPAHSPNPKLRPASLVPLCPFGERV